MFWFLSDTGSIDSVLTSATKPEHQHDVEEKDLHREQSDRNRHTVNKNRYDYVKAPSGNTFAAESLTHCSTKAHYLSLCLPSSPLTCPTKQPEGHSVEGPPPPRHNCPLEFNHPRSRPMTYSLGNQCKCQKVAYVPILKTVENKNPGFTTWSRSKPKLNDFVHVPSKFWGNQFVHNPAYKLTNKQTRFKVKTGIWFDIDLNDSLGPGVRDPGPVQSSGGADDTSVVRPEDVWTQSQQDHRRGSQAAAAQSKDSRRPGRVHLSWGCAECSDACVRGWEVERSVQKEMFSINTWIFLFRLKSYWWSRTGWGMRRSCREIVWAWKSKNSRPCSKCFLLKR